MEKEYAVGGSKNGALEAPKITMKSLVFAVVQCTQIQQDSNQTFCMANSLFSSTKVNRIVTSRHEVVI
jgi:hypothetical protein